jgi:hypothetical protein
MLTKFLPENVKGRDRLEDLGVDVRIILKFILSELGVRMWTGLICLRIGPSGGLCEHCNEPLGSIKHWGFHD